jgi:hypothetical protein
MGSWKDTIFFGIKRIRQNKTGFADTAVQD